MKRGKVEIWSSEPLFPRLNVNDREIGGPRAPPRNKMALYEQLTIPSQRFNPTAASVQSRSTFTSSDVLIQTSTQLSKRSHQQSYPTLNTKIIQSGRSFKRRFKNSNMVANGLISNPQLKILSSHEKKSCQNLDEENNNDFNMPTFVQSKITPFNIKISSSPSRNLDGKLLKESYATSLNKRENTRTLDGVRCFIDIDVADEDDKSRAREEVCSKGDEFNQPSRNKATVLPENEEVVISEISDATMIGPDNVVELIGPKHFWKARRAILDQQRIFAIQVFELHRLIKVQKTLAASPNTVKVDIILSPSPNITAPENLAITNQLSSMQEISSENQNIMHSVEKVSAQDTHTTNTPSSQLCYPPNLNQWLMPVMSPSEGLVYKPFPGPYPPASDYVHPFYGNPNHMSFPVLPPYNVQYQLPPYMYYPSPYVLPFTNSMEHVSMQSSFPIERQPSNLSSNQSKQTSEAITSEVQKNLAAKLGDLQGSQNQHKISGCANNVSDVVDIVEHNQVIKVVPHKAVLATESAARILRFIQEERKNPEP